MQANNGKNLLGFEWSEELEEGVLENLDRLSCMEIIPENFFEGRFDGFLKELAKNATPVAVHGVLLSLGTSGPINQPHLDKVMEICERVNTINFSEHLSLTQVAGIDLDALTPLAFDQDVADEICRKIDFIQSILPCPFLFENVSNRFMIPSELTETEFINQILNKTGCGLLLDVTNVFTNSVNFKFDPIAWLDEIDLSRVGLIHLAGGTYENDGFLMDSHDNAISKGSWELYEYVCQKINPEITIIERTGNFPGIEPLLKELAVAKNIVNRTKRKRKKQSVPHPQSNYGQAQERV